MNIANHLIILQILIPFGAAIIAAFSFNLQRSYIIALIAAVFGFVLSLYNLYMTASYGTYQIGGWPNIAGIEYLIDGLNQPVITFFNFVLCFYLLFHNHFNQKLIINYIDEKQQYLFYPLLLFAHTGYLGVVSSNDLFNIYVFIEISSLSTYVLMSIAKNRSALIGSFDYLILGTIGATLILIGVGFILAITGNLNITLVQELLLNNPNKPLIYSAMIFILVGALLKIAFFPMHFWMRRAYNAAPSSILTYIAGIGTIFGTYLILRFTYSVFDLNEMMQVIFTEAMRPLAIFTIIIGSFFAFRASNLKEVIIYSATAQIGYIVLLITLSVTTMLLPFFLLIDAINKISWFAIISHLQVKSASLNFDSFKELNESFLFQLLVAIVIISSAGLPISGMFFVKIQILDLLISEKLYIEFISIIAGTILSLLYNFRIARLFFHRSAEYGEMQINSNLSGLIFLVLIQISIIFYITNMTTNFI